MQGAGTGATEEQHSAKSVYVNPSMEKRFVSSVVCRLCGREPKAIGGRQPPVAKTGWGYDRAGMAAGEGLGCCLPVCMSLRQPESEVLSLPGLYFSVVLTFGTTPIPLHRYL